MLVVMLVAGCSDHSGSLGGVGDRGGASGIEAPQRRAAEPAPGSSSELTPALRAATLTAVQRNAGEAYRFKSPSGVSETLASNPAQKLTAKLTDGALRIEPFSNML